jgi:N4-gp56 family major capsid protein
MPVQKTPALTPIIRNAALFAAATRTHNMTNMLTGPAPKGIAEIGKMQTDSGAPIVRVTDLTTQPGQQVTVDIVHRLTGRPTMGDRRVENRSDTMTFAQDTVGINQGRHVVDNGGAMFVQTIGQPINQIAQALLKSWYKDLDEETTLYHLAGARGSDYNSNLIVPLETDPEYAEIMVNPVVPPTFSRHFYGGDATSVQNIDSSDLMSLTTIDNLSLYLQEMASPIKHVALAGDEAADENPFYILFVTPRQWRDLQNQSSTADFNKLVASAMNRSKGFKHPLFTGDYLMKDKIMVRRMNRRIRFNAGSQVRVSQNNADATTTLQTASVNIERAFLLGSQALAYAHGRTKTANSHFSIREDEKDNGNIKEYTIGYCNGKKALQFRDRDGVLHDHGRIIVDTAVGN